MGSHDTTRSRTRSWPRGRGVGINPANRFERLRIELDKPAAKAHTELYRDTSRTIISYNTSPDVPFDASLNPYRGCEHGCAYCYARPTHEFLGYSAGLDFETRILVKPDAAKLLRRELSARAWRPRVLALSGVTDPYQPIERHLRITRSCLGVLAHFRNPVAIITKNELVCRDIDRLAELARHNAAAIFLSITSLDRDLARTLEPRASSPGRRLAALRRLADAGIACGVMVAPVIPGLTEHEIPAILRAAAAAGATSAGYILLRLPGSVAEIFDGWLARNRPQRRDRVMHRVRALRAGRCNDLRFGARMRGSGAYAEQIDSLFTKTARRCRLARGRWRLSVDAFRNTGQQRLFSNLP